MNAVGIIEEARDHHPSFDPQRVPPRVALRALSRLVRRMAEKVTALSEDALATPLEIGYDDLQVAVGSREGIVLPAHLLVLNEMHTWRSDRPGLVPVEMVVYSVRYQEGVESFPAVALSGGRLYPVNLIDAPGASTDRTGWEDYRGLRLSLVPLPAELAVPDDAVGLPDATRDALVLNLAVFMAGRSGAAVVKDLPLLAVQAQDAENAAVSTLTAMDSTTRWTIQRRR